MQPVSPTQMSELNALANRANALFMQGDIESAVNVYRQALAIIPHVPEILANMALALYQLRQFDEAYTAILKALNIRPNYPEALNTLGNLHQQAGRVQEAVTAYRRAIHLKPDYLNAQANIGKLLQKLKDDAGAIEAYTQVLRIAPNQADILAEKMYREASLYRWETRHKDIPHLKSLLSDGKQSINPFAAFQFLDADAQLRNAQHWSIRHLGRQLPYTKTHMTPRTTSTLKIGYLSSDFYQHATAYLISELFEQHCRNQFTIFAYCSGAPTESSERNRIKSSVDHFRDIRTASTKEACDIIRNDNIDILVDLKGYTNGHRMDIMAARPAPLQMHYLGFPGTTGASCIDYIISDTVVTPANADSVFSEKLIRLPHTYQINDQKRPLPPVKSRNACGLPEHAFIFCGFNQSYKITPAMFDTWLELLAQMPNSILWLLEHNLESTQNIKQYATNKGIDASRIVMAKHVPLAEHMARFQLADLFLDTSPVCGHTTASDALWCAVPVVTMMGESFVSRVATSLLHAVQLPELVTHTMHDYKQLALLIAQNPDTLNHYKHHLRQGRLTFPLFDSKATTRAIESAYIQAFERHMSGKPPESFSV